MLRDLIVGTITLGLLISLVAILTLDPPTAEELCAAHPTWSATDCQRISEGIIWLGMDAEQLQAGWGRPTDINRTVSAYGVREQWVYRYSSTTRYVYLDDGIVASWQI